ncbi:unnamed protein product [Acidithrix sp. C25]|nr:unnamed protein product [Acidithrix sp. C25]
MFSGQIDDRVKGSRANDIADDYLKFIRKAPKDRSSSRF